MVVEHNISADSTKRKNIPQEPVSPWSGKKKTEEYYDESEKTTPSEPQPTKKEQKKEDVAVSEEPVVEIEEGIKMNDLCAFVNYICPCLIDYQRLYRNINDIYKLLFDKDLFVDIENIDCNCNLCKKPNNNDILLETLGLKDLEIDLITRIVKLACRDNCGIDITPDILVDNGYDWNLNKQKAKHYNNSNRQVELIINEPTHKESTGPVHINLNYIEINVCGEQVTPVYNGSFQAGTLVNITVSATFQRLPNAPTLYFKKLLKLYQTVNNSTEKQEIELIPILNTTTNTVRFTVQVDTSLFDKIVYDIEYFTDVTPDTTGPNINSGYGRVTPNLH